MAQATAGRHGVRGRRML